MAEISPTQRAELLSLLAAYCDDVISDADGARLEYLLLEGGFRDQAQAIYVDYVSLHWDLRKENLRQEARESLDELNELALITADADWFIQEAPLTGDEPPNFASSPPGAARPPDRFLLSAVLGEYGVALAGLTSALAILLIVSSLFSLAPEAAAPKPPGFAVLKSVGGCQWAPDCRLAALRDPVRFELGVELTPGEVVALAKGQAEIAFASGARISLDAPARLILSSTMRCELETGRLYAKVPQSAVGFTIAIPAMDVVDLGTEFGIEVFDEEKSEVHVLAGKVEIRSGGTSDSNRGAFLGQPRVIEAGSAIRASDGGEVAAIASDPIRFLPAPASRTAGAGLDIVDLICGGDGSGLRQGTAVDPGSGEFGLLPDADRPSDGVYHRISTHRALDGCFLPKGSTIVDSAGHAFEFPRNANGSGYLISAGGGVSREQPNRVIPAMLRGAVFAPSPRRMLLMHPNVGLTLDLSSIRRRAGESIRGFDAVVLDPDVRGWAPKGDVYAIVDGASRFERRGFTVKDTPFAVHVALRDSDRFLTLVTTDGGDSGVGDWITWGDAVLETESRPSPLDPGGGK